MPFPAALDAGDGSRPYRRSVERWRRVIGHDGYMRADLQLNTPNEGGRSRSVQSGYHAQWWQVDGSDERWLGSGPLDLIDTRSIKPGATGSIKIYPMHPPSWRGVGAGAVLHLRERVAQTLGVAVILDRVQVPDEATLRLDTVPVRPHGVRSVGPTLWERLSGVIRGARAGAVLHGSARSRCTVQGPPR